MWRITRLEPTHVLARERWLGKSNCMKQVSPVEEQKHLLEALLPKWIELYDRAVIYFFGVAFGVASFLGKEVILSGRDFGTVFAAHSIGSWFLLWTTLLCAAFLLWYNYISEVVAATNFALASVDPSYRAFILDKDRIWANAAYVVLSHAVLFGPPLAALVYYNRAVGIGWPCSWFAFLAQCCSLVYCVAIILRIRTLLLIGRKVKQLRQATGLTVETLSSTLPDSPIQPTADPNAGDPDAARGPDSRDSLLNS